MEPSLPLPPGWIWDFTSCSGNDCYHCKKAIDRQQKVFLDPSREFMYHAICVASARIFKRDLSLVRRRDQLDDRIRQRELAAPGASR